MQDWILQPEGGSVTIQVLRDPEGAEVKHLLAVHPLDGKKILEIGCGNGCLTWQYAAVPQWIIGIDPDLAELRKAGSNRAAPSQDVSFIQAMGEALPYSARVFDVVLFSSSF
jgi:ubiquinone/menaquinone biosynthesis C-methylase UbiE